jgi:hypothetical protein
MPERSRRDRSAGNYYISGAVLSVIKATAADGFVLPASRISREARDADFAGLGQAAPVKVISTVMPHSPRSHSGM